MRFNIQIELNQNDYERIKNFLDSNSDKTLELFPSVDFEFVAISPLLIFSEDFGYSLKSMVSFQKPIGLKVFDELKLDNETIKVSVTSNKKVIIEKNQ